ncbi:hypothetical protein [Salinisphaera sp. T31B1]|uniref:hypothetical protein n=1 Tax=Salinisphaera sp. T31B1 TaxID=727963 RepID=UPI0033423707
MSDLSEKIKIALEAATPAARIKRIESWIESAKADAEYSKTRQLSELEEELESCRHLQAKGETDRLHWALTRADMLRQSISIEAGQLKHEAQSSKGGRRAKRSAWAERVGELVSRWNDIPGADRPLTFELGMQAFEVYRDGDTLVAVDADSKQELRPQSKSNFLKRYLKK